MCGIVWDDLCITISFLFLCGRVSLLMVFVGDGSPTWATCNWPSTSPRVAAHWIRMTRWHNMTMARRSRRGNFYGLLHVGQSWRLAAPCKKKHCWGSWPFWRFLASRWPSLEPWTLKQSSKGAAKGCRLLLILALSLYPSAVKGGWTMLNLDRSRSGCYCFIVSLG